MKRRRAFIEAYNSNPMNFLPGNVGRAIYKHARNTRVMHAAADDWIRSFNSWAPPEHQIEWPRLPREIPA